MAACGIPNLPSGPLTGVTSTVSHSMGTFKYKYIKSLRNKVIYL
jgi:hypothetical protein